MYVNPRGLVLVAVLFGLLFLVRLRRYRRIHRIVRRSRARRVGALLARRRNRRL